jgi:hypothetical protein
MGLRYSTDSQWEDCHQDLNQDMTEEICILVELLDSYVAGKVCRMRTPHQLIQYIVGIWDHRFFSTPGALRIGLGLASLKASPGGSRHTTSECRDALYKNTDEKRASIHLFCSKVTSL